MREDEALGALKGDDPDEVARAEATLWRLWSRSGRPEVDALFAEGVQAMEENRYEDAERVFDLVIARAPDFAEGWNKRATIRYLRQDYAGSIADCEATLARNPHHFGALSGEGLCHLGLGQHREAAGLFRRALEVHPHLAGARINLAHAIAETVRGNGH